MINKHKIKKGIVLLSGGIDSVVTAAYAQKMGYKIIPLFFDYGQIVLKKELFCAHSLAKLLKLQPLMIIKLPWLRLISGKSGLIRKNIKLISKKTWTREYVPFRNTIFLSIATALAESLAANAIFVGSTATDRICPDNRPIYLKAMQKVIRRGTKLKTDIKLLAPLVFKTKTEIVRMGHKLNIPFQFTWSCHKTNKNPCGLCSNCVSRSKAFRNNNLKDPIVYEPSKCKRD